MRQDGAVDGFGILIVAFGYRSYIRQAETLAASIRINMPDAKIAIATDAEVDRRLFDIVRAVDLGLGKGVIQKMYLDQYSPFEKTLFIDADCIMGRSIWDEVSRLAGYAFTPVCERYLGPSDHDEYVADLAEALKKVGGAVFPKFNGGVYYFDRSEAAKALFERARDILRSYRDFGVVPFDRGGPGDETVYALAMSSLGMTDLYDDKGRLMRTPIGMEGALDGSALGSGFNFTKYGKRVEPAICHFAGPAVFGYDYFRYRATVERGGDDYLARFFALTEHTFFRAKTLVKKVVGR